MRSLVFAILAAVIAAEASACSCITPDPPAASLQRADVVFAGVVVSIEDPAGDRLRALPEHERAAAQHGQRGGTLGPEWGRKVTFRVLQWWKAERFTESIELWTAYGGGDCGYPVETGKSYLVYGRRDTRNQLVFGICGRTAALICALPDLEELGEPIKSYETFDAASLAKREQPYTTYWRPCITPAALIGERGLEMDKHCRFEVEGVITTEGTVRDFRIVSTSLPRRCPDSLREHITERVAAWRFRPAQLHGEPVESSLTTISMREPATEAEH